MDKWLNFFRQYFESEESLQQFIESCENLERPNDAAKIMMHQCQRLVSLSDDIEKIRSNKEALKVLFLMMCAENISKLHDDFDGEGQSRRYARQFFDNFTDQCDIDRVTRAFTNHTVAPMRNLEFREAVDMLYDVRCDVVHEGKYWGFAFHDGKTSMLNTNPDVTSNITYNDFRNIVVRACINAIRNRL